MQRAAPSAARSSTTTSRHGRTTVRSAAALRNHDVIAGVPHSPESIINYLQAIKEMRCKLLAEAGGCAGVLA